MKKYFKTSGLAVLAAAAFLTACDPEIDAPEISKGDADFTRYVAIGNSLTAGFGDGGLYRESQLNSFPNILAGQFKLAGGGEFTQPLFSEDQKNGSGYLKLTGFTAGGSPIITRIPADAERPNTPALPGGKALTKYTDPVNNLGVPGMSVKGSATPLFGAINPYFERLLEPNEVGTKSYQQVIGESNPTFFTCWLGNIDVLTYATSGGVASPANPFSGITDQPTFNAVYNSMITNLVKNGAKGVVATIPNVTLIPFFTTVTVPLVRAAANNAPLYITTDTGVREADSNDLILLTTQAAIGRPDNVGGNTIPHGFHPANALTDAEVLDKAEVGEIKDATIAFNNIIISAANANNLAIFDVNAFFQSIQPVDGKAVLVVNTVNYTPAFISGNLFSLDGVHLTPRGYALVANEFIKVINTKYNAKIPTVNVNAYNAVLFP
ncbi:SGNH/GDSL hydrolase family protein [Adhaeribacter sp. BT258]|uniref:SGNH/GDSL hydrolase family protein n=1 Tax=Adhaeribacter terrigena TaxID=2793070 RepID=A0ABS1C2S5_9BACT|nr:SGNH/GDSL hydrolase family protein [Adhaeribacter terrigena]MBK0403704.1 SGNH/GDSL hydrolase family protein [Adhaeribacter terrigena]